MELHTYEVSNWWNDYSNQRYPKKIEWVKYVEIISKKYPNGMLSISAEDVDGHFCAMIKCYIDKEGKRYGMFGKHRIYEGFSGGVRLIGVPYGIKDAIRGCCESCGSIVE